MPRPARDTLPALSAARSRSALGSAFGSAIRPALGAALDLMLPPRCPSCREIVDAPDRFCARCWNELAFITPPWCSVCGLPFDVDAGPQAVCGDCAGTPRSYRSARAAFRYTGSAVPVLLGFKHADRTHLARLMAQHLHRFMEALDGADLIVPVPLDRARLRKRGYNQAGLVARHLARTSRLPLSVEAMARVKPTASTAGMSRAARLRSAQGAFAAQGTQVAGRRVVLVDDVMTTGATAEAAARALVKAGAQSVDVLTFARAMKTDD